MDNEPLPQDIPRENLADGYILKPAIAPVILARYCTPDDVERKRIERERARDARRSEFIAKCARHGGASLFDTSTGACLSCLADHADLPVQVMYRAAGGTSYVDHCEVHGAAVARFGESGCALCVRPEIAPRIMAQRAGAVRYDDTCETCGPALFSVRSGRCLTCNTREGVPRDRTGKVGRPREAGNVRAEARRAGEKQYLANCEQHGQTPHSVAHGKCLTCFNAMGQRRPR